MGQITKVSLDVLRIHPRNQEFFDDIAGEDYERFKSSIEEDGIISEIIVSPDMTILSGHQRYKAAKELGFSTVPIRIREDIETEDQKLKLLLAANFGRQTNSKSKQRKIADEYVRLCGMNPGDNQWSVQNGLSSDKLTLKEIAAQLGTSEGSLKRSLRIERNLSDDMKQLLDEGIISETFAADVIAGMTEEEQLRFISGLDITKKYTARELQPYVNKIKELKENPALREVTVVPDDYDAIKQQVTSLSVANDSLTSENERLKSALGDKEEEIEYLLNNVADTTAEPPAVTDPSADEKYAELSEQYNKEVTDYKSRIAAMESELSQLRRIHQPTTTAINDGRQIFDFCTEGNKFIMKIVELQYSDAFRKIQADRSMPLNALTETCDKIIDAINELMKNVKTADVIDLY